MNTYATARTHDKEQDGEYTEAHELDGLSAPAVDEEERGPIPRDESRHRQD